MTITVKEIEEILRGKLEICLRPLSKISLDDANDKSMLDCTTMFFDYDLIARKVYEALQQKQTEKTAGNENGKENMPKTPDMIFFRNNMIYFVEFKNGWITKKVIWDVKLKALEGSFIALQKLIAKYKVSVPFMEVMELRKVYILVYNQAKFEAQVAKKIKKLEEMKNKKHVKPAEMNKL